MSGDPRRGPGLPRAYPNGKGSRRNAWEAVYALVREIPRGRVMTYGQIATLLAQRISPRAVGWALHGCPCELPWHRVVNALGGCSTDRLPDGIRGLQRARLEGEGVEFRAEGTLDLGRYRWTPPTQGAKPLLASTTGRSPRARRRQTGRP